MSRVSTILQVPPKMYRHFAVVTLLVTLCIAIFADGERREAIADEIESQQQKNALREADAQSGSQRKLLTPVKHYPPRDGGGSDGGSINSAEGSGPMLLDSSGIMRSAFESDLGRIGPAGLAEMRAGTQSEIRNAPLHGGKAKRRPTERERKALENAGIHSAGAPTPPIPAAL